MWNTINNAIKRYQITCYISPLDWTHAAKIKELVNKNKQMESNYLSTYVILRGRLILKISIIHGLPQFSRVGWRRNTTNSSIQQQINLGSFCQLLVFKHICYMFLFYYCLIWIPIFLYAQTKGNMYVHIFPCEHNEMIIKM